ncbi:MAG: YIP1 family protein, partial [Simkaniaceae bacterium]|nr:YIP1 family protein [Simkaniaceae bacterium]
CQTLSLGHFYGTSAIVLASIILAIPVGYILMSISSLFFFWTGKLFRGKARYIEVRAAVSWANVPSIVTIGTWIVLIIALGSRLFMADRGQVEPGFGLADVMFIIQVIIAIWSTVILILGVAEVQGFSGWRALGNFILVICIWVLITLLIMYLVVYVAKPAAVAFLELL